MKPTAIAGLCLLVGALSYLYGLRDKERNFWRRVARDLAREMYKRGQVAVSITVNVQDENDPQSIKVIVEDMGRLTLGQYAELAMRTKNRDIKQAQALVEAAMGAAGEAGEFVNQVKKVIFHQHDADPEELAKELGDILWYVARGADALGIPLEEIARRNIRKLWERYPDGFSAQASINRKD